MRSDAPQVRRLYDDLDSGNGYKVRLALTQLGIPFDLQYSAQQYSVEHCTFP